MSNHKLIKLKRFIVQNIYKLCNNFFIYINTLYMYLNIRCDGKKSFWVRNKQGLIFSKIDTLHQLVTVAPFSWNITVNERETNPKEHNRFDFATPTFFLKKRSNENTILVPY